MRNINSLLKKIDLFVKMASGQWKINEVGNSEWVEDEPEPNQSINPDPTQYVSKKPEVTPVTESASWQNDDDAEPAKPAAKPAQPVKQQTTYDGKVGAAAASVANTLKTLVALPDAQKEASQKQIDDAKKRLIPYLAKTLMPYLPGDVQDEYTGIINSFNAKYNLLVQKFPEQPSIY